ncbi:MAG: T9SS type B sorting domain-containing protein [Bacteroidetes bacterium]|nr:T9SS type B sorting domain-containing protein [Bacteroidota bacterium]
MRPFALLLAACGLLPARAQELVPNGGFEQWDACPAFMGELDHATGWAPPTTGSTDYFNACQGAPFTVSVPTNLFGHQPAHGGTGYAGFIGFNGPENTALSDIHEYASHPLAAPLVPGEAYAVEFFVNLADISAYAVNDIGALFSVQPPHRADMLTITATPQVAHTALTLLSDTSGWMRIQGCFTADSAYACLTIGNFHTGATTGYAPMPPTGSGAWFSYYYVDDVRVRHVPRPLLGPDLLLCEAATLHVLDPVPGADYRWSTGATGPSIHVDTAGTYSVQLVDDICPLTDTLVVRAGTPVALALPPDTTVDFCRTPRLLLQAQVQPPAAQVQWSTGDTTAELLVDAAGTYTLQAHAPEHCAASAAITVTDACRTPVYAPDAFTPNGDGINDVWRPVWRANPGAAIAWSVYDRWGRVLRTGAEAADAWDGTVDGAPMPPGLYPWRGRASDPAVSGMRELSGYILLMR